MSPKKTFSKREKILMGLVGLCTIVGGFRYAYAPLRAKTLEAQVSLTSLETQIAQQRAELNLILAQRKPSSIAIAGEYQNFEAAKKAQFTDFVESLTNPDSIPDFRIVRLSMDKAEQQKTTTELFYTLIVSTNFKSAQMMMQKLERAPVLIKVQSMEIVKDPEDVHRVLAKIVLSNLVMNGGAP